MVEYSGINLVLVFYIINQDTYRTVLWITWFTIVGFFRVFTIIARERSRFVCISSNIFRNRLLTMFTVYDSFST
jgi:hypothetical protein